MEVVSHNSNKKAYRKLALTVGNSSLYVCQRTTRFACKDYNYIVDGWSHNWLILCWSEKNGKRI